MRRRIGWAGMIGLMVPALAGCGRAPPPRDDARSLAAYDQYRRPELVLAGLALERGQLVADVGAGRGYLTARLAAAVGPGGRVVATDVDPRALAALRSLAQDGRRGEAAPIEPRLVTPSDPGLERERYHRILLAEVDHLLPDRADYLGRLRAALAPGGRVAVTNRLAYRAPVVAAAARAGFRVEREVDGLPGHFLVLLEATR